MPSHLHERFLAYAEDLVETKIQNVSRRLRSCRTKPGGQEIASQLDKIYKGRSATIELRSPGNVPAVTRRNPDATFYHPAQPHLPRLVIEVGYSQPRSELQKLADNYITGSHGAIGSVVGFDLPYPFPSESNRHTRQANARVLVWKGLVNGRGTVRNIHRISKDFRNAAGSPCRGSLALDISDLLPTGLVPNGQISVHSNTSIKVPLAHFASFLSTFEGQRYNLRSRNLSSSLARPTTPTTPTIAKRTIPDFSGRRSSPRKSAKGRL